MRAINPLARWKVKDAPVLALRSILSKGRFAHWVPAEVVLYRPNEQRAMPSARMATLYAPRVRELTGLDKEQWPDMVSVSDTCHMANYATLVEAYSDYGSDGHTEYRLHELVLIRREDSEALKLGDPAIVCPLFLYYEECFYYAN